MIIEPKIRGFICITAHPEGCGANVKAQADYCAARQLKSGPKRVLVIGASTGYGLASRVAAAFSCGASTIGVAFERPASGNRTASAGWYNTAAFERLAKKAGLYSRSFNGDAFGHELKKQVIEAVKQDLGQVDLVVYSLAAPFRVDPDTGIKYGSVLKPIGKPMTGTTVDVNTKQLSEVTIQPATQEEIDSTIKVMGGQDWKLWIDALYEAGALADNAVTLAYSYIGPQITHAVYKDGTIGKAKEDVEATARELNTELKSIGGRAYVCVNKAVVTQASSAIPIVPLYIAALFRVMKPMGLHEGCIEQIHRLYGQKLYVPQTLVDEQNRIRVDDWEMRPEVQAQVLDIWQSVKAENLSDITDIDAYRREFLGLFGFGVEGVDYAADTEPNVQIPSIPEATE